MKTSTPGPIRFTIATLLGLGWPICIVSFVWLVAAAYADQEIALPFLWFAGGLISGGLAQLIGDW